MEMLKSIIFDKMKTAVSVLSSYRAHLLFTHMRKSMDTWLHQYLVCLWALDVKES